MKKIFILCQIIVFVAACEPAATDHLQKDTDRGSLEKTSVYGGCDLKTECWNYIGSDYANSSGQDACLSQGGQFVRNGCRANDSIYKCHLYKNTPTETHLLYYVSSGLSAQDALEICQLQGGGE